MVKSVSSKLQVAALKDGLKLQWKFILSDYYDYDGEEIVEYEGVRWNVVANYRTDDHEIELTATRC